ncbi:MAG: diguanylate cyclase [Alphaproteobacteria bacterium]
MLIEAAEPTLASEQAEVPREQPMTIVIVDDILANAMLMEKLVQSIGGVHTRTFIDPIEALEWCECHTFDVLLLDYLMPALDGISFLKRMRRNPSLADVPAVMITAEEKSETLYEALNAGANDFLKKPVDPIELAARTRNMLRLRARQLELERANQQLALLANTDGLTGVANRRYFLERMEEELERGRRYHSPLALALLDVDHFKQVNDQNGHQAGDEVLKALSDFTVGLLRSNDLVGRLGGEEFAILMPESDEQVGAVVSERVRAELAVHPIKTVAGDLSITVSIGVTQAYPDLDNAEAILRRADRALYRAKSAGRNRVIKAGAFEGEGEGEGGGADGVPVPATRD